jgi:pimeloyl-ACP methyl ester carboxylesterase
MARENASVSAADWIASGSFFKTVAGHKIFHRRVGTGPALVMLHGFPTWSYDYANVEPDLAHDHTVVTLDFLGYGASDKPKGYQFTVDESADTVEQLLRHLGIGNVTLVIHDYGAIVGQELLDRRLRDRLSFRIDGVHILNCSIVYSAYRPLKLQRQLITPIFGAFVASRLDKAKLRAIINAVRGTAKLTDTEFDELWLGMSRDDGHKLAHRHIRYNTERGKHHGRWEAALAAYEGPLQLIWGLDDPVSGRHVLDLARQQLPRARVVALDGVGHFPQSEVPAAVASAIRGSAQ